MREKVIQKRRIYTGRVINVRNDKVLLPNGKTARREFIEHPGAVAAVVFADKKNIILLRQYRYPVGRITWEIPAGKFDGKESRLQCLKREVAEETGMMPKKTKFLLSYLPTSAFSTEVLHIFAAWDLKPCAAKPDEDEFLQTRIVSLERCYEWILKGRIKDSKTIIALLAWERYKKKLDIKL